VQAVPTRVVPAGTPDASGVPFVPDAVVEHRAAGEVMPAPAPNKSIKDIVRLHLQSTGQVTLPAEKPGRALTLASPTAVLRLRRDFLLRTIEDLVRKYDDVDAKIKEREKKT